MRVQVKQVPGNCVRYGWTLMFWKQLTTADHWLCKIFWRFEVLNVDEGVWRCDPFIGQLWRPHHNWHLNGLLMNDNLPNCFRTLCAMDCIRTLPRGGMYWEIHPPRPERFPEGCKIPARGKSRGPRGMYFPMHPDSRQCTSILSALAGKYWFCGVFFIWNLKDLPYSALACTEWALHHPKLS